MTETLLDVAAEFGAFNPDIVNHARKDVNPRLAMTELRHQFPASFKPVFDARTATPAEIKVEWAKMQSAETKRYHQQMHDRDMAKLAAQFGKK